MSSFLCELSSTTINCIFVQAVNDLASLCKVQAHLSLPVSYSINMICLSILNLRISCFENSVHSDQLASEKPADQDPHCFPLYVC